MSEADRPTNRLPRRTIAKGAAWSVPVVAVGAAAPALAASGGASDIAVGNPCKLPGTAPTGCAELYAGLPGLDPDKSFAFPLLVSNNTPKAVVLKPSITMTSSGLPFAVVGVLVPYCTPIAPGSSVKVIVYANSDNAANSAVTVGFSVPWGHDCSDTDHPPLVLGGLSIPGFSPCSTRIPFPTGSPTCDPPFYQSV